MKNFTHREDYGTESLLFGFLHWNFDSPKDPKLAITMLQLSRYSNILIPVTMGLVFSIKVSVEILLLVEECLTKKLSIPLFAWGF